MHKTHIDGYYQQIELLRDLTNPKTAAKSQDTRDDEIKNYEDLIEEQKRIREMEEGEGSVVDAAEAHSSSHHALHWMLSLLQCSKLGYLGGPSDPL